MHLLRFITIIVLLMYRFILQFVCLKEKNQFPISFDVFLPCWLLSKQTVFSLPLQTQNVIFKGAFRKLELTVLNFVIYLNTIAKVVPFISHLSWTSFQVCFTGCTHACWWVQLNHAAAPSSWAPVLDGQYRANLHNFVLQLTQTFATLTFSITPTPSKLWLCLKIKNNKKHKLHALLPF